MKFLAICRRRVEQFPQTRFDDLLDAEASAARALYASGHFREIHSRGDVPGAVIVIEAADLEEARNLIGQLPFAQHELMDVEIVPLRPYRGFAQ